MSLIPTRSGIFISNGENASLPLQPLFFPESKAAAQRPKILGIATPVVDEVCSVTSEYIKKLPVKVQEGQSVVIREWNLFSSILQSARKTQNSDPLQMAGGSCANVIKTLSFLLKSLGDSGHSCELFGKLGDSATDQIFRNSLEDSGVALLSQPTSNPISQALALTTTEGKKTERTFIIYPNLSKDLSLRLLTPKLFEGVNVVHFEGYSLREYSLDFIKKAIKVAYEAGATVSFDLGCDSVCRQFSKELHHLLEKVDMVFVNELELEALCEGLSEQDACTELSKLCPIVILKKGARGALVTTKEETITSPAIEGKACDPNSAGDAFASGFIAGYLNDRSLETCAKMGNILGGKMVASIGPEIGPQHWPLIAEELKSLLLVKTDEVSAKAHVEKHRLDKLDQKIKILKQRITLNEQKLEDLKEKKLAHIIYNTGKTHNKSYLYNFKQALRSMKAKCERMELQQQTAHNKE